ncbi:DUF2264 domain-containing protein [Pelagicoccus albus]|uniref:DUF2264 domain-containing protein n=1 Tax=Pelagicoccus albus TaxID=415222 RepID=A0A7X1E818_9BACT|nr:DUF2264 domain-containing protein [Pelagicoccus albus]MBC2605854.1 DUF2264 domain-containing protein [Pelagicoccus albus]
MKSSYTVENPDYQLSPKTGMTRSHYIELAKYLLEGAFQHIDSFDDILTFPLIDGKTYPQEDSPAWRFRSLEFEALERTFTLAAPLIHNDPETEIKGINLRDYYANLLYKALTPGNPNSLPMPEDLPDSTYQYTCEFGGLFKTLLLMPDTIWSVYTEEQKAAMVKTISAWGHHRTTQNNWRIFNITTLSFLKKQGYEIDDGLLLNHLQWVVSYHSGDGWYLEQTYNYYSISLFIVYTTIWNRGFGDEYYPEISKTIEKSAQKLMESIGNFFGRDGYINMWSRSICYRTWVSGAFPVAFMLENPNLLDGGWARRLCSGSLLQFVTKEEFFVNGIPSLGFYGQKDYMVQSYSCPASPFLMFLPFICLALPEDSPFWTETENDGFWEDLGDASTQTLLPSPGLMLVNHGKTGTSEIIPGKVYYDDPNYSKLTFNTHFPWEDQNPDGGTSMEYAFRSLDPRDLRGDDINFYLTGKTVDNDSELRAKFTHSQNMLFNGQRDGVLYRQAIMRQPPNNGVGYIIDLAEITLPGGVLRVDRTRLAFEYELTLGHFGLPHIDGVEATVEERKLADRTVMIARIPGRSLAFITYHGWDQAEAMTHDGNNAEADSSTVLFARKTAPKVNPKMEILITAMLHKMDDSEWTEEELSPVKDFTIQTFAPSGSPCGVQVNLSSGASHHVDYQNIDGLRTC